MGVRSTGRVSASSSGGAAIFSGASDPTKSLDISALPGLKVGDEYLATTSGMLFFCLDPTAGAAKWQRSTAVVQVFNTALTNATINFPAFASVHEMEAIASGGGGGSGRVSAAGVAAGGGDGGSGGTYGRFLLRAADLGSVSTGVLTIGTPGIGGAANTTDSTDGNDGGSGNGLTLVINSFRAMSLAGGLNGRGGKIAGQSNYGMNGAGYVAGQGGINLTIGNGAAPSRSVKGGSGAPAGGSITAANVAGTGGGTAGTNFDGTNVSTAVSAVGANGSGGVAWPYASSAVSGTAPSGGGASLTGAAGSGFGGSNNGCGGSGSGAARDGQGGSPKAGDGALGIFIMISRP